MGLRIHVDNKLVYPVKMSTEQTCGRCSDLSEFLRENLFYTEERRNEKFWLISTSISLSSFLLEVIDKYTLGKGLPRDVCLWQADIKKNKDDLIRILQAKPNEIIGNSTGGNLTTALNRHTIISR